MCESYFCTGTVQKLEIHIIEVYNVGKFLNPGILSRIIVTYMIHDTAANMVRALCKVASGRRGPPLRVC